MQSEQSCLTRGLGWTGLAGKRTFSNTKDGLVEKMLLLIHSFLPCHGALKGPREQPS